LNGTIIWANKQISGKGYGNNQWISEEGKNLTFSAIIFPKKLKAQNQFYLSKAISIGICEFLRSYCKNVYIKWPNDIYIDNKKIGGILIENTIKADILSTSIIGIGLNINQTKFPDNLPNPISLKLKLKKVFDLESCLFALLDQLDIQVFKIMNNEFHDIDNTYLNYLYRFQEMSKFTDNQKIIFAKIIDVKSTGEIILEDANKQRLIYGFKEITFID
jgi:BirA family biotin operon repressor/biotin-[acetyl-CoA-carboxylase] ligase